MLPHYTTYQQLPEGRERQREGGRKRDRERGKQRGRQTGTHTHTHVHTEAVAVADTLGWQAKIKLKSCRKQQPWGMPAHTHRHTHTTYFQTHSHVAHTHTGTLTCGTHSQAHSHVAHTHSLSLTLPEVSGRMSRRSTRLNSSWLNLLATCGRRKAPPVSLLLASLPACSLRAARAACTALLCVHFRFLTPPPYTLQQQLHLQLPSPPAGCCAIFNKLSVISRVQPQRRHLCQCTAEQGTRGRTDQCQSLCP